MEVNLELVAKIDTLFADMKKFKDGLVEIDKTAVQTGKDLSVAFKSPAQDINNIVSSAKVVKESLNGLDGLLKQLAASNGPEELISNFEALVVEVDRSLPTLEALEFKLKALQNLRPFVTEEEDLKAVDLRIKEINTDLDKLKSKDISKPTTTLKTQLAAARNELSLMIDKYGALDPRTLAAAKSAGILADKMKDINATINALNPDAKLQAFTDLGQGIAGSFAIATGALGLFGFATEDVQKGLIRIQSAIQLTQGINQILQLKDAWTNVKAVIRIFIADTLAANAAVTANTGAVIANTEASAANVAAKEANAIVTGEVAVAEVAATGAATGLAIAEGAAAASTGVLTTALALLTGPLGIILVTLGALFAVYKLTNDEVDENNSLTAEQIQKTNELAAAQRALRDAIADTKDSIRVVNGTLADTQAELLARQRKFFSELDELDDQFNLQIKQAQEAANSGLINDADAFEKALTQIKKDFNDKRVALNEKYAVDTELINAKAAKQERDDDKKRSEERKKNLEQELNKLLQLRRDYQTALENVLKQGDAALADLFGGTARIELERAAALREIDELKKNVRAKGQAEVDQAKKIYGETSTQYKEILDKFHEGIISSDQQFAILRRAVNKKAEEDLLALSIGNELARTEAILNEQERLMKQFEINFKKRSKALLDAGATQVEIDNLKNKELLDMGAKFVSDDLDQQEAYYKSEIELQDISAEREIDAVREKQIKILTLEKQFNEARILNLQELRAASILIDPNFDTTAIDTTINELKSKVNAAKAEIQKLENEGENEQFSFAKLLGLKLSKTDEEDFNAAADSIIESAKDIYSQLLEIRRNEVQQQIELNQRLIDSLDNRVDETERQLDRELKLRELGFASNVEATQKQLDAEKKARDKAFADKQKLMKQEQALARQAATVAAIQQIASLGTAAAKLFEKGAFTGPVGIITAIATIAGMLSAFLQFKASLTQAATQSLGEGGWIKGKSHSAGGVDINAEHDEFMMRRYVATKHPRAMEAINDENWEDVPDSFLIPILKARGIRLSTESTKKIMDDHSTIRNAEASAPSRLDKLEALHAETNEHLKVIKNKINDQEERTILPDGSTQIKKGNKTTIILPSK